MHLARRVIILVALLLGFYPSGVQAQIAPTKPTITITENSNPANGSTIDGSAPAIASAGTTLKLTATVQGTQPLAYQWMLNGVPLQGGTNSDYTIQALERSDEGSYSVVVTNGVGSSMSDPVRLLVSNVKPSQYVSFATDASTNGIGQIEYVDSLGTNAVWRPLAGVTSSVVPLVIVDPAPLATNQRFYRSTQTNALKAWMSPGWIYSDPVGSVYGIEFIDRKAGATNWQVLQALTISTTPFLFVDETATNNPSRRYRSTLLTPVTNMAWISPGTFLMGSPTSEIGRDGDETQHPVTLTRGFYMGKYEVTQAEFQSVMGFNPSYFRGGNLPVETVLWDDAVSYCNKLTVRERDAGRLPQGYDYRLPTEAQWEYACRAGTTTATSFGNVLTSFLANFAGQYPYPDGAQKGPNLGQTTPVGQYGANAFGLYDMDGNVWEWCADYYDYYPSGPVTDPAGPPSGARRVDRGGGWTSRGQYCRSAYRGGDYPAIRRYNLGFRVALVRVQ